MFSPILATDDICNRANGVGHALQFLCILDRCEKYVTSLLRRGDHVEMYHTLSTAHQIYSSDPLFLWFINFIKINRTATKNKAGIIEPNFN